VLALGAMIIAPLIDTSGSVYNYLQKTNATFFGPMLAVILLGFVTRRTSAVSANFGLVAGPVVFFLLVFVFGAQVQTFLQSTFHLTHDLHFLHFLAFIFLLTIGLMLLVSTVFPNRQPYEIRDRGVVDLEPWRWSREHAILISIVTILMYVLFAR
jgi:SSS family solute:Na+ symporter